MTADPTPAEELEPPSLDRAQGDPWEEYSEMLRENGFTGVNIIGDFQFTICRRCGAWLMLPTEPVPTDEYFAFETTWLVRHLIEAHPHNLVWDTEAAEDLPLCPTCAADVRGAGHHRPHVYKHNGDVGLVRPWRLCPGKERQ